MSKKRSPLNYRGMHRAVKASQQEIFSTTATGRICGVSPTTIHTWIRDGLKTHKVDFKNFVILKPDLLQYLSYKHGVNTMKAREQSYLSIRLNSDDARTFWYAYTRWARGSETFGNFAARLCRKLASVDEDL